MSDEECGRGDSRRTGDASENVQWMRVYEDYHEEVRRYFARRVRSPHDVDDLVQNVFASLLGRCGHLSHPEVYVRTVAKHKLFAYWRHRRRSLLFVQILSDCDEDSVTGERYCTGESDPLEQLLSQETIRIVHSLIDSLTPALADALRLRFLCGLAIDEAAAQAGCSREALKKRLNRARESFIGLYS